MIALNEAERAMLADLERQVEELAVECELLRHENAELRAAQRIPTQRLQYA